MKPTLNNRTVSAADICRLNGWGVGTRLAGDEGYGVTIIEITAVGEAAILAKALSHKGEPCCDWSKKESAWVLWCRDWTEVKDNG